MKRDKPRLYHKQDNEVEVENEIFDSPRSVEHIRRADSNVRED